MVELRQSFLQVMHAAGTHLHQKEGARCSVWAVSCAILTLVQLISLLINSQCL